jgi:hypothetical protein
VDFDAAVVVNQAQFSKSLEWRKIEAKLHELLGDCASAATGVGSIIPSATGLVLTDSAADVY